MLDRLRQILEEKEIDAIIIQNLRDPLIDKNFFRYTKFISGIFENSYLVIDKESITVYTSPLEYETAKSQAEFEVVEIKNKNEYLNILKSKGYRKLGLNLDFLPYNVVKNMYNEFEIVDISKELNELREIKEEWEIERIQKAVRITEKALEKIYELEIRNMTEKEIRAEIEYYALKFGGEGFSFNTIVAFDKNAADPHYSTGHRDKKGEKVLLIDIGVYYRKYTSDITRTFILDKTDKELKEVYETCLEAQLKAFDEIREGVIAEDVDKVAREIIESKYGRFIHSLGHMIGLDVHDSSKRLAPNQKFKLKENMVFTNEPGIYIRGKFGVRIEDDVVVKKGKALNLVKFPKEFDEVCI